MNHPKYSSVPNGDVTGARAGTHTHTHSATRDRVYKEEKRAVSQPAAFDVNRKRAVIFKGDGGDLMTG